MKTNSMNVKRSFVIAMLATNWVAAQGFGEIRGLIKDDALEPVPFATVKILQGNLLIGGTQSDMDGKYHYKPLNPGVYEMIVIEAGHQTQPVNKISIVPNEATYVDVKMKINSLGTVEVIAPPVDYTKTGVDKSMFSMTSIDSKDLNRMAGYNRGEIKNALEMITTDAVATPDGEVHFRGSRGDASGYFVDGVRTLGPVTIPGLAIENITVFSGGVPAAYGDVTSGVVVITTKSYFSGMRDKNIRVAEQKEKIREAKREKKALADEIDRKKEIEAEKEKELEKN
jgi:hypothetical protein